MSKKKEKTESLEAVHTHTHTHTDNFREKGITLVALVVTIVVLLILAGVSINMVLGENGIVTKAKDARDKSAEASQNDLTAMDALAQELENAVNGNSNTGNNYMKQNTKVTYPDGDVWVPEGFKIADDSASTVKGGVVIEDKDQNQFVWIPVASISDYKRTAYLNIDTNETDSETNSTKIKVSSLSSKYFIEALPSDEQTSVNTYKGYYIGRYEAGDKESTTAKTLRSSNDVSKKVTIKANQAPYNYVTRTQAESLAKNFGIQQGYKAKTKLVSSYAWDTAIAFIQKTQSYSDYGNSSPQGNYYNTTFTYNDITVKDGEEKTKTKDKNSSTLVATGQTTPVCNIYDMGGNVAELTTESWLGTDDSDISRGGFYACRYDNAPAGYRGDFSGSADGTYDAVGFRLTLFL